VVHTRHSSLTSHRGAIPASNRIPTMKTPLLTLCTILAACSLFAQGPKRSGTLKEPIQIPLVMSGKQVGSSTVAAGTSVAVIEEKDGKVLVSVAAGQVWVDAGGVEIASLSAQEETSRQQSIAENPVMVPSDQKEPAGSSQSGAKIIQTPAVPAPTQLPEQRKPKISIDEKHWTEDFKSKPPGKCKGIINKFKFTPSVILGTDLAGTTPSLRFYLIVRKWSNEKQKSEPGVTAQKEVSISEPSVPTKAFEYEFMDWKCSCCRGMKDGEYLGWYADLFLDNNVVAVLQSTMSSSGSSVLRKFLKENQ